MNERDVEPISQMVKYCAKIDGRRPELGINKDRFIDDYGSVRSV